MLEGRKINKEERRYPLSNKKTKRRQQHAPFKFGGSSLESRDGGGGLVTGSQKMDWALWLQSAGATQQMISSVLAVAFCQGLNQRCLQVGNNRHAPNIRAFTQSPFV